MRNITAVLFSFIVALTPMMTQAGMAGSAEIIDDQVSLLLENDQLMAEFADMGLSQEQLTQRISMLTPAERAQLSDKLADLPVGQDVLGTVFAIFLLLVITDMIGATDVFDFVNEI